MSNPKIAITAANKTKGELLCTLLGSHPDLECVEDASPGRLADGQVTFYPELTEEIIDELERKGNIHVVYVGKAGALEIAYTDISIPAKELVLSKDGKWRKPVYRELLSQLGLKARLLKA